MLLELMKTKDILARLGEIKTDSQYLIGFALEAKNEIEYGRGKLEKKNCDMIVVNSANKTDSGFGGDNNTITLLKKDGSLLKFEPQPKSKCADIIFEKMG
ncbi:MAG: hypothetical protein B7C24_17735 [Bacteroidetes bacterium 4572_77]|nr:MAG: hypothetical protein B7C24_17735 [Bacteroidetes bacterium 4572_77]